MPNRTGKTIPDLWLDHLVTHNLETRMLRTWLQFDQEFENFLGEKTSFISLESKISKVGVSKLNWKPVRRWIESKVNLRLDGAEPSALKLHQLWNCIFSNDFMRLHWMNLQPNWLHENMKNAKLFRMGTKSTFIAYFWWIHRLEETCGIKKAAW